MSRDLQELTTSQIACAKKHAQIEWRKRGRQKAWARRTRHPLRTRRSQSARWRMCRNTPLGWSLLQLLFLQRHPNTSQCNDCSPCCHSDVAIFVHERERDELRAAPTVDRNVAVAVAVAVAVSVRVDACVRCLRSLLHAERALTLFLLSNKSHVVSMVLGFASAACVQPSRIRILFHREFESFKSLQSPARKGLNHFYGGQFQ